MSQALSAGWRAALPCVWGGTFATSPVVPDSAGQCGLFWRGFATSGLNPKTLLFFPSFFP